MKGKIKTTSIFYLMTSAMCAIIFFGCKTAQSSGTAPPQNQIIAKASPTATPISDEISQLEIKSDEVSSLEFETVYKDYYDEGSKCRKDYVEYFGGADGATSPSSPCTINLSFKRDGAATKTIEVGRYDKTAKGKKIVERNVWTAKISGEQFDALAKTITANEAFRAWRDGMMITVSNSSVSATHPKGTRTVMSNVDKTTTAFMPMLDSFKELDGKIKWEKSQ